MGKISETKGLRANPQPVKIHAEDFFCYLALLFLILLTSFSMLLSQKDQLLVYPFN